MKIGICGGTFDPFHRGHLDPVLHAGEVMGWDRIVYVPAYQQPFKIDLKTTSSHHRFSMAVLATEDHAQIFVNPWEVDRGTISYTVDTLEMLRQQHREATLDWIIGDDNLPELPKWKSLDRLLDLANFAVLTRLSDARQEATPASLRDRIRSAQERGRNGALVFVDNATVPVSATEVRRRVRAGEPVDDLVHPRVRHYIHHNGLYREVHS